MKLPAKIEALLAAAPEADRALVERLRAKIATPDGAEKLAERMHAKATEDLDRLRDARLERIAAFDSGIPERLELWRWERDSKAKAAEPRAVTIDGLEAIEHLDHVVYQPKKGAVAPLDEGRAIAAATGKPCRVAGIGTVDP